MKTLHSFFISTCILFLSSAQGLAADGAVAGLYKALLFHDATNFYQFGDITVRTTNPGGGDVKMSATVIIYFGNRDSNEFLTYEFEDLKPNPLTGKITLKDPTMNVSLEGTLKPGKIEGEWFSSVVGRVGKFTAIKTGEPTVPTDAFLVKSLTGHYRGVMTNTNPESALPEKATISLVTTQDVSGAKPVITITGNARIYWGEFGSGEYEETKFTEVKFDFYKRYLTAKTEEYGLTFRGTVSPDGNFTGLLFAEGFGEIAKVDFKRL